VWQLAAAFIEIALQRRGPETLPDSKFLLLALVALNVPLGIAVRGLIAELSARGIAIDLFGTALYLAFVFAVLRFFKFEQRYVRTMSALLGIDVLVQLVLIAFGGAGLLAGMSFGEPPLWVVYLVVILWWIVIAAFILGRALSQPMIVGLMFVLIYLLTQLSLADLLQPAIPVSSEAAGAGAALLAAAA
jgi:hypothetical protein